MLLLQLHNPGIWETAVKWLPIVLVAWILLLYCVTYTNHFMWVHSRWHHLFDAAQFSGQAIYASVTATVELKQIPNLSVERVTHKQTTLLGARREYLKLKRGDQMIMVCASPFGNSFFVSWWFGEAYDFGKVLARSVPFVGKRLEQQLRDKTYYQADTDTMFCESVHHVILAVVDSLTQEHGIRGLTDLERTPIFSNW